MWIHDRADVLLEDGGESALVRSVMLDVTERHLAEEALTRRDAVLEAVGFAAARFLKGPSWGNDIDIVLQRLGRAAGVSRVYIFQNLLGRHGELLMDERFEWIAPGIPPTIEDPENHNCPYLPDYRHYVETLGAGRPVVTRLSDASVHDRADLEEERILSTAFVPIFAADSWWGFLGFDDCVAEREWSPSELDALKVAASTLGAAISREQAQAARLEAETRYRTLVEQIPAVTYVELAGATPGGWAARTLYISPQVEAMLGVTPQQLLDNETVWATLVHPDDLARALAEDQRAKSGDRSAIDYRMVSRDGRLVWIHDESVLVRSAKGGPDYWHGIMFDVTPLKQAERELERALGLERAAVERLQALDELRTTFLHAVSHELRTPLTAILGIALTLEHDDGGLPRESQRDLVGRLAANARKLDGLLANLLDLDRLDRGILEPDRQPTDVGELVRRLVEDFELLHGHRIHLDIDSVTVNVDASKVERIVENLLANAARHTSTGTDVWVAVHPEADGVLILVEDAGDGIDEELRASLFEPFRRRVDEGNPTPGLGIGLSLVARFAELHGGRAWVEDRLGGGASFRVILLDHP